MIEFLKALWEWFRNSLAFEIVMVGGTIAFFVFFYITIARI